MLAVLLALGRYSNNNSRVGQVLTCRSEMLSRICELRVRTQPYKPAVDHADHTAPTRQRELQIVQITQIIQIMQIIRIHTSAIKHLIIKREQITSLRCACPNNYCTNVTRTKKGIAAAVAKDLRGCLVCVGYCSEEKRSDRSVA